MRLWNPMKQLRIDMVLFCSFASIVILLLSMFGWFSYRISTDELIKNTSLYQTRLLHELTNRIDSSLTNIEQTSVALSKNFAQMYSQMSLASNRYQRDRLRTDAVAEIEHYINSIGSVDSVYLYLDTPLFYDEMGQVYFFSDERLKQEAWFPQVEQADEGWIAVREIQTARGKVEVAGFVRKIYNNAGKVNGLLLINVKTSFINSMIEGDRDVQRVLIDSSGGIVSAVGQFPLEITKEHQYVEMNSSINTYYKIIKSPIDGQKELFVWSKILGSNWTLYEVTPWDEIITSGSKIARTFIFLGLVSIILTLAVALLISRQFVSPIKNLTRKMGAFTFDKQKEPEELPNDYNNEFGILYRGYSKLLFRIEELYKSLEIQYQKQREVEIKALQAMMNPHFLYNSLDQINWMAIESGQKDISEMLSLLGKMYRVGLSKGSLYIRLEDELFYLEGYLKFQKVRWKERLVYRIENKYKGEQVYIPRLTLQPFVENCFIHGFHKRKSGTIEIVVCSINQTLEIRIMDNGVGIDSALKVGNNSELGGYGIYNVQEQYNALFGEGYGYELKPVASGGTVAIIRLPLVADREGTKL